MKIKIGLLCLCMFLLAGCDPAPNYNKTPNTSAAEEITMHAPAAEAASNNEIIFYTVDDFIDFINNPSLPINVINGFMNNGRGSFCSSDYPETNSFAISGTSFNYYSLNIYYIWKYKNYELVTNDYNKIINYFNEHDILYNDNTIKIYNESIGKTKYYTLTISCHLSIDDLNNMKININKDLS